MDTKTSSQKITPFLWFDKEAEEAVNFYVSAFPDSRITSMKKWPENGPFPADTVQTAAFNLAGAQFYAFDAGPQFQFNPSISFLVISETSKEVDDLWNKFMEGGTALMPLDSYAWSERYGWVTDRFGISWQLMKGELKDVGQRITPLLMFSGEQRGNAEDALTLYMSIFENSSLDGVMKYSPADPAPEGMIKHAQCRLAGQTFMVMDNGTDADIPFSEAISFYVNCKDQEEVDYFWNSFTKEGNESMCGWLKDKFGVSWQIIPEFLTEKAAKGDPQRVQNMMVALYRMRKLNVGQLEEAYNQ